MTILTRKRKKLFKMLTWKKPDKKILRTQVHSLGRALNFIHTYFSVFSVSVSLSVSLLPAPRSSFLPPYVSAGTQSHTHTHIMTYFKINFHCPLKRQTNNLFCPVLLGNLKHTTKTYLQSFVLSGIRNQI